jgi:prepilin-type N-terminal cleavage/methylation domain-containing protein
MALQDGRRTSGFTLVELMVVVAIIGVLASVAIPSFQNYQLTSKRTEAFSNLASLAKSQKAYFAEFNEFVGVASEPGYSLNVWPGTEKRDKTPLDSAFADVGWVPDGDVFFDYDTVLPASAGSDCDCTEACFTAAAYGNLDGDEDLSVLLYAHPDMLGQFCNPEFSGKTVPVNSGGRVFDQVVRVLDADDF